MQGAGAGPEGARPGRWTVAASRLSRLRSRRAEGRRRGRGAAVWRRTALRPPWGPLLRARILRLAAEETSSSARSHQSPGTAGTPHSSSARWSSSTGAVASRRTRPLAEQSIPYAITQVTCGQRGWMDCPDRLAGSSLIQAEARGRAAGSGDMNGPGRPALQAPKRAGRVPGLSGEIAPTPAAGLPCARKPPYSWCSSPPSRHCSAGLTGQDDTAVGTPIAGPQPGSKLEGTLGFFVNHVRSCAATAGRPDPLCALARVRRPHSAPSRHEEMRSKKLARSYEPERRTAENVRPLCQAAFSSRARPPLTLGA